MLKPISTSSDNSIQSYVRIAAAYSSTKLALMLIRHPIGVVEVNKQAYPGLANVQIIKNIYQTSGFKGFYRGTTTSIAKIFVCESYRGVLTIKVPKAIRSQLSPSWAHSHPQSAALTTSLLATLIISPLDATIICPFLRIITLQTTANKNNPLTDLYKNHIKGDVVKKLYRGYPPLFIETLSAWGIFFVSRDISKFSQKNATSQIAFASLLGGSVRPLINLIPNIVRIQMQMVENQNLNMRHTLQNLIKSHGVRALFCAVPHKLLNGTINQGYRNILQHFLAE